MLQSREEQRLAHLHALVRQAPLSPGVYLWKNEQGSILYVGKAIKLRQRLTSYFTDKALKTQHLMARTYDLEVTQVSNEYEALVLENNLIKLHKPKYNIQLRDQKSYPVIRITNETFPRVLRTRSVINDGSTYFGPFPGAGRLDEYLDLIDQTFLLRKCNPIPLKPLKKPCLQYDLKRCTAPCTKEGNYDVAGYQKRVKQVHDLLSGNHTAFLRGLNQQMAEAAAQQRYEEAARLRDAIATTKKIMEGQHVENQSRNRVDYVGYVGSEGFYHFVIMRMREGKITDKSVVRLEVPDGDDEVLEQFITQYYTANADGADIVYVQDLPSEVDFSRFFREEAGGLNVQVLPALKQRDAHLVRMAYENALLDFSREGQNLAALVTIQNRLDLPTVPKVIEGFDVSHLSGHFTVASLVAFRYGLPDRPNYRRFKIRSVAKGDIDDFKSLSEAVARRLTRLQKEEKDYPDLLLIDGGKGQVSAVQKVIEALGLSDKVAVAGLAKREEEVFLPYIKDSIILAKGSPELRILQAVRNETHRVAISYNKLLRKKQLGIPSLESVPGIGPKKAKQLLSQYGSLPTISQQTPRNLAHVARVSEIKALEILQSVQRYLQSDEDEDELPITDNRHTDMPDGDFIETIE